MWFAACTVLLAALAAISDFRKGEIPNHLTLPVLVAAPVAHFWVHGPTGALFALAGVVGAGLGPYVLFRARALGGGDVKLFAAMGGLTGLAIGLEIVVVAMALGSLQALVVLAVKGRLTAVLQNAATVAVNMVRPRHRRVAVLPESLSHIRLGPAIFVGAVLVLVTSW